MAEISTATRDDDPDDAAGQYPSTVTNKYHRKITQELADDDDDDHSGVVGSKRIEKMGTGPLTKESEYHPTKYSGNTKNNLVGDEESQEIAAADDRQYPAKKAGEVVQYPPKNNHEESIKYSGRTPGPKIRVADRLLGVAVGSKTHFCRTISDRRTSVDLEHAAHKTMSLKKELIKCTGDRGGWTCVFRHR
jgi:hypothetical protein